MGIFRQDGSALIWEKEHERVRLEAWGVDGLRVRATQDAEIQDLPNALLPVDPIDAQITLGEKTAAMTNGCIRAEIDLEGHCRFVRQPDGRVLLEERPQVFVLPPAREYRAWRGGLYHVDVRFLAQPGERIYGLGQHTHGYLDQRGCVIELMQRNTQVSIPFLVSNRMYGFLWNNPAVGRVELGRDVTHWVAEATRQVDYFITTGKSYADIMERYADATGHAPMLPEKAAGFWQCKLRYRSQEELLNVAREYKRRGLPLDIIVVDFFHWTMLGDWQFDPKDWPDPAGMVRELDEMGISLMVSIWPSVNPNSKNFAEMQRNGWLVRGERGIPVQMAFEDASPKGRVYPHIYDATHPGARHFVWEQVRENYLKHGIKIWWLDACEPEIYPADVDNLRYHLGSGLEVGNLYPLLHEQAFYEGMRAAGETEIISLCRSAWAGSQRFGAAVWSGDIPSTFEMLAIQVRAGLNIAMSGIPWWTTDIGGFTGGNIESPYFRELIVRWFQFGLFCPLFRLHGYREPAGHMLGSGADNEVWSFGEEAYAIIKPLLFMREMMRPYIMAQMQLASEKGTPLMRPLFFDFPDDATAYAVEDQFLFGPDILVAPVLVLGARERQVYLPDGTDWQEPWTGARLAGGQWITAPAPLERIPIYFRWGSAHKLS
jgi:alpha-D-xyloside xylohydrolase